MKRNKSTEFINCIFEGSVSHNRVYPKNHSFKYNVFCLNFDLCDIKGIFKRIPLFSINKFNLFSFYYSDYGPKNCKDLEKWIKTTVKHSGIKEKIEAIFMLAYPRMLGYVFNPLTIYTCVNKNNKVIAQIYEVHNTFSKTETDK